MPDISNKNSHQFWYDYPNPTIYKAIAFMEGVEDWTLDGNPVLEEALAKLGNTLDNIGNLDLQAEDSFIKISLGIKMGRALRLLQCMDVAHPGAAAKLLAHAENAAKEPDSIQGLFLQRNIVFERLRLFNRIFSEDRFIAISKALGE